MFKNRVLAWGRVLTILFLAMFFGSQAVWAKVPTPTILQVVPSLDNSSRPWVVGLTPNPVSVEVWLDGKAWGMAKVVKDDSGTASFGWAPSTDLSVGTHQVQVRGKFGKDYSELSLPVTFVVPHPTPAPVLIEPEIRDDYVLIKGLLSNNTAVKIYIDGVLYADFSVPNHPSGTTNFWFKARGLLNGVHKVYARAYDATGKLSKKSNEFSFQTEFQKITKGEEGAEAEQQKNANVSIIDKPEEGKVEIAPAEEGEVRVATSEEDVQIQEEKDKGEVSSIAELAESDEGVNPDKVKRNREVGVVLLVIIIILLVIWYQQEKKRLSKDNKEAEKDNYKAESSGDNQHNENSKDKEKDSNSEEEASQQDKSEK